MPIVYRMPTIPPQIVGHDKVCGQLLHDIAKKNTSHAYLFVGPKNLGKFTIARWFAWRILADGAPVEQVSLIKEQIERLIHPDLLSLDMLWIDEKQDNWKKIGEHSNVQQQHREKSKAKTDSISIDDIRALHGRLFETGVSEHLCCLIRSVERMKPEAANALLKVLEEPPPRVIFILTAESEHALLPTIVSRTRLIHFHPLKKQELAPLLTGRDPDESAFAVHLAQGAPGALISLLDDPEKLRSKRQLHGQAKQFWQMPSLLERLQWIMPFVEKKHDLSELVFHLGLTLREDPNTASRAVYFSAYIQLLKDLETNAHKGLLFQRFAVAVQSV